MLKNDCDRKLQITPIIKNMNKHYKICYYITIIILMIGFLIFWSQNENQTIITKIFSKDSIYSMKIWEVILYMIVMVIISLLTALIYTFFHELIHFLILPVKNRFKKTKIVFSKLAISVDYNGIESKNRCLISLIAPFILFLSLTVLGILISNDKIIVFFAKLVLVLNFMSIPDIISFFVVLKKVPRQSYIYKNIYYINKDQIDLVDEN